MQQSFVSSSAVIELEKQLRMGDQHRFFQKHELGAAGGDERRSIHSASVTREGDCCATKGVSTRERCNSSARC